MGVYEGITPRGLLIMVFASFGGLLFAFLCDYGKPVVVKGVETCNLTTAQQSLGTGIGSAGIIINSIAMGLACNVIPIYLSETSTASARGFVINMYQMVQIIGVIIASGSVYAVSTRLDKSAYLIPMGIQLISPTLILCVVRRDEAIRATETLFKTPTNNFDAVDYVQKLELAFEEEKLEGNTSSWGDLVRQPDLRRVLIALGIQSLQQAQGSSYMTNYIVS
ncbi:hypothetical protein IAU60_006881 [Kwoniella sp. DSM 27419]